MIAPALPPEYAEGRWRMLAPFPSPTWEMEAIGCGGRLWMIGGITNAYGARTGWIPNRHVASYDPRTDGWALHAPFPAPAHHLTLAVIGETIFAFGGYRPPDHGPDAWEPIADAWRYDAADDRWTPVAPLPGARGAAAAAVLDGRVYLAGGSRVQPRPGASAPLPDGPHVSLADLLVYDPVADRYDAAAPLLTGRNHHRLEAVGGQLFAIGGRVGASNVWFANKIDLVEAYDPVHDAWWPRARMLAVHSAMSAGVHAGRIYAAGGEGVTIVEAFDPEADRWTVVARMPRPRLGAGGTVLGDRFHIVAGHVRTPDGSEAVGDNLVLELG